MLKSVLYYLLLLTTTVRFVDMLYLLAKADTNLPAPVLVVTSVMILYGVTLVVKKFIGGVRIKQLMVFYMAQVVLVSFNLAYINIACPLQISISEAFVAGTFLDILVGGCLVYASLKQLRSGYAPIGQVVHNSRI